MRKILAKVDDARLGRAVAGLMDGSIKVVDVQRDEHGISALLEGTRDEFTVYIEGKRVHCSCLDFYSRRTYCKHIAAVALHELGAVSKARSERRELTGLLL